MKFIIACLLAVTACAAFAAPATAQVGGSGAGVTSGPPSPQPRARVPDFAPAAVPGAGGPTLATSQAVPKVDLGNPTTELFNAVNSGDYNSAQDAVSRGADMNAQNALGETPLDLSIALNHNTITFMLLSARNESGGDGPVGTPWPIGQAASGAPPAATAGRHHHDKFQATPVRMVAAPIVRTPPAIVAGTGTPDPNAGFLGFGH